MAPPGHTIKLSFVYFDLEDSDYFEVGGHFLPWQRLCGELNTTVFESTGRNMVIIFTSNERVIGGGFKANYRAIPGMLVDRDVL